MKPVLGDTLLNPYQLEPLLELVPLRATELANPHQLARLHTPCTS